MYLYKKILYFFSEQGFPSFRLRFIVRMTCRTVYFKTICIRELSENLDFCYKSQKRCMRGALALLTTKGLVVF